MDTSLWKRVQTTRMYLHPPMSDRMYTLWRDSKLIFGHNKVAINEEYFDLVSSGIRFLFADGELDFRKNEYKIREDAIPNHSLVGAYGDLAVTVSAFATPGKGSVCHVKLHLENRSDKEITEKVGFMLRTAKESDVVFEAPDVYRPFRSNLDKWRALPSTFVTEDGKRFTDGDRTVCLCSEMQFDYDGEQGTAFAVCTLGAGEAVEAYFAYSKGNEPTGDYESELLATEKFWESELRRITSLPEEIKNDPSRNLTVKSLAVQLMQCFVLPEDADFTLARQGGLQRQIWTFETMPVLEALDRLGDFDSYVEPIIDLYFNNFLAESGEIVPLGIHWAMVTGTVLYSFGVFALNRDKESYERYADRAFRAFGWIREKRRSLKATEDMVEGLFPPMSSCDDPLVFQSWTNTDTFNLIGLEKYLEAAKHYGDPRAAEIEVEYLDYLSVMRGAWRDYLAANGDPEMIDMPYSPKGDNRKIAEKFAFIACDSYISLAIKMDREDVERILRYRRSIGVIKGGLYNRMIRQEPDQPYAI